MTTLELPGLCPNSTLSPEVLAGAAAMNKQEFREAFQHLPAVPELQYHAAFMLAENEVAARHALARFDLAQLKQLAFTLQWTRGGNAQVLTDRLVTWLALVREYENCDLASVAARPLKAINTVLECLGISTTFGNRQQKAQRLQQWALSTRFHWAVARCEVLQMLALRFLLESHQPVSVHTAGSFRLFVMLEGRGYRPDYATGWYQPGPVRFIKYQHAFLPLGQVERQLHEAQASLHSAQIAHGVWNDKLRNAEAIQGGTAPKPYPTFDAPQSIKICQQMVAQSRTDIFHHTVTVKNLTKALSEVL